MELKQVKEGGKAAVLGPWGWMLPGLKHIEQTLHIHCYYLHNDKILELDAWGQTGVIISVEVVHFPKRLPSSALQKAAAATKVSRARMGLTVLQQPLEVPHTIYLSMTVSLINVVSDFCPKMSSMTLRNVVPQVNTTSDITCFLLENAAYDQRRAHMPLSLLSYLAKLNFSWTQNAVALISVCVWESNNTPESYKEESESTAASAGPKADLH